MDTRRSFIKKAGSGIALSALGFSSLATVVESSKVDSRGSSQEKPLRIGIIGAENSHTIGYGKMFNIEKKFPGAEVLYVWGETAEFASKAAESGQIPNIVSDPMEMMGKIDALIVDHRHPKFHLEAAAPFVKAGIPTFIDKPFCYRLSEGKEFLEMARRAGTPVASYSSIAQSDSTFDIKEQVKEINGINQVVRCGPIDIESPYGGIFFYGVHTLEPLMNIFGDAIERVRVAHDGKKGSASLVYADGLMATLIFKKQYSWETYIETEKGFIELKSRVEETNPARNYIDMVEMFRTGKEPVSHGHILKTVAVLEALEESVAADKWVEVKK